MTSPSRSGDLNKGRWLSAGFGRAVLFSLQLEAEPPSQEEGFVLLCTMSAQILSNSGAECGAGHFRGAQLCATTAWGTQHSQQLSCPRGTQPDPKDSSVPETPVATGTTSFPVPGQRGSSPEELMSPHKEAQEQPTSPSPPAEHLHQRCWCQW